MVPLKHDSFVHLIQPDIHMIILEYHHRLPENSPFFFMRELSQEDLGELLKKKVRDLKNEQEQSKKLNEKLEQAHLQLKQQRDNLADEVNRKTRKLQVMNEELNDSLDELKKAEIQKEEFLSMVTHELKTPLTPIIGWCEALKTPNIGGKLTKVQDEAIDSIYSNSKKLHRLIGDVLDAHKLDLDKMVFTNLQVDIGELLNKTINDFKFTLEEKNIQLIIKFKGKLKIASDERRLSQVFTNLINNAVDFVPAKVGKITLNAEEEGGSVVFSVKDNGTGIEPKKQKKLFKKFYQVDTSVTRKHGGTGLGLTVCKGIINGLGGKIWVESQMGKGTAFYFSIPKKAEWEEIENTRN